MTCLRRWFGLALLASHFGVGNPARPDNSSPYGPALTDDDAAGAMPGVTAVNSALDLTRHLHEEQDDPNGYLYKVRKAFENPDLRLEGLFKNTMEKPSEEVMGRVKAMQSQVDSLEEAGAAVNEGIDKFHEHANEMDDELNSLDGMLTELAVLRRNQFAKAESSRMRALDNLRPEIQAMIHEVAATAKGERYVRVAQAHALAAGAMIGSRPQSDDVVRALTEIERAAKHGGNKAGLLDGLYKAIKGYNDNHNLPEAEIPPGFEKEKTRPLDRVDRTSKELEDREEASDAASYDRTSLLQLGSKGGSGGPTSHKLAWEGGAETLEKTKLEIDAGNAPKQLEEDHYANYEGWTNHDEGGVIAAAKDLMPSHEAMERWDSIPAGSAMQIKPEHAARQSDWLREILIRKDIQKFGDSNKASDQVDKAARDLAEMATKATKHLVDAHKNAQSYHTKIKQHFASLQNFVKKTKQLGESMTNELKRKNNERLKFFTQFDEGIKNGRDLHNSSAKGGWFSRKK